MKAKNYIYLRGGVVSSRTSKSFSSITLATDGNSGNLTSFPTIVSYDNMFEGIKIGERVTIEAHVQLRPIFGDNRKIVKYETNFVCDHIELNKRPLAAYVDDTENFDPYDGGTMSDENYALIFGRINRVYVPHENFTLLSIHVPAERNQKMDICEVGCFKRQSGIAQMLEKGDYVMVYGSIRTKNEKDENGNLMTKQHVICKDILKVKHLDGFSDPS